jgi:hypothetical protein
MKQFVAILLFAGCVHANAQKVTVIDNTVTLQADSSLTVHQAFLLAKLYTPSWTLLPVRKYGYELYVVKDGNTYYRPYVPVMRKNRAWLVTGKQRDKVKI